MLMKAKSSHKSSVRNGVRSNGTSRSSTLLEDLYKKIDHLNEWKRRLSVLLKFGKKAVATTNLDDLLQLLIEEAKMVLNAERATVFLVDKKQHELWSRVASG